jgi:hypothetical protein
MNFTLVAACRGRYSSLERFIRSVFLTPRDRSEVELFIMSDEDDPGTHEVVHRLQLEHGSWNLRLHKQPRTIFLNRDYINLGVAMGTGRFTWALGNDVEIVTPEWDQIVLQAASTYFSDKPDGIGFIFIDDDLRKEGDFDGCCFPIMTREAVNAVGFHMPPEIATWGADFWLWQIYKTLGEDRVLRCPDVRIYHHCHHNGRTPRDEINIEVERNYSGWLSPELVECYTRRLREAIVNARPTPDST